VFKAVVEGVFRRLGDVLSVRNGSGSAEQWTSVSPCLHLVLHHVLDLDAPLVEAAYHHHVLHPGDDGGRALLLDATAQVDFESRS